MKNFENCFPTLFLYFLLLVIGFSFVINCDQEAIAADQENSPKTLAIMPFENNSVTDSEKYAPLSKGLAAMLITDLDKSGTSLKLIERDKIQSILKEIALNQSGGVDAATAAKAGKILGAQSIAFGSFMVIGKSIRIDTRIIEVETSEMIMAESITGDSKAFMELEQSLAKKIAKSLKIALKPTTTKSGSNLNAAIYFSSGLDALDKGDNLTANKLFKKCIELDMNFKSRVEQVTGVGL
ncbi:hypothetical protein KAJ27_19445 [bacterium]|nr:hypothetical protein [bacterium]